MLLPHRLMIHHCDGSLPLVPHIPVILPFLSSFNSSALSSVHQWKSTEFVCWTSSAASLWLYMCLLCALLVHCFFKNLFSQLVSLSKENKYNIESPAEKWRQTQQQCVCATLISFCFCCGTTLTVSIWGQTQRNISTSWDYNIHFMCFCSLLR